MTQMVALMLVLLTGLYLVGLAVVATLAPAKAARFLFGFASSARAHYLELVIRIIVGGAILLYAPRMLFSHLFSAFGWVLVITTACLLAIPWQWHHRFAQRAVPHAVRNLPLVSAASFVFGVFILTAVILGAA